MGYEVREIACRTFQSDDYGQERGSDYKSPGVLGSPERVAGYKPQGPQVPGSPAVIGGGMQFDGN